MKLTSKSGLHRHLGTFLRRKREAAGYTQSEIAKRLGYSSPQFISNFERGLCSPPLKNLKALVKVYRMDPKEVIHLILKEQEHVLNNALQPQARRSR